MALLYMDGFDAGDQSLKYTVSGSISSSTNTRFSTGRSLMISGSSSVHRVFTDSSQFFVGFAYLGGPANINPIISMYGDGGGTQHVNILSLGNTSLTVRVGSTNIQSVTVPDMTSWSVYIELSATIATSGGRIILKVNGETLVDYTGNTKNGGTGTDYNVIWFGAQSGFSNRYIDDLYICNSTGSAPYNTFLGDVRVHTIVPNGAGSSTQLTSSGGANYTAVDELPYSATDYVYGTAGQTDLYAASDLPGGAGVIYGVQTSAVVKKTDAGNISARSAMKSGATTYYSSNLATGTSDQVVSRLDANNPATAAAWTSGEVNGIEIGVGTV